MTRALVVPVAGLLAAAALALVASGAFAVGDELRTGVVPSNHLGASVASRLVGARPQRALTEAIRLLHARGGTVAAQVQRRQRAQAVLARLAAHGNGRAANLLGVLTLEEAQSDQQHAHELVAAALAAFVQAIHANPQDEDAKYNLELLLAQRRQTAEQRQRSAGKQAPRKGRSSARRPGAGY